MRRGYEGRRPPEIKETKEGAGGANGAARERRYSSEVKQIEQKDQAVESKAAVKLESHPQTSAKPGDASGGAKSTTSTPSDSDG